MRFQVEGLDHVAVGVEDQAASQAWYRDILGLERTHADAWGDTPIAMTASGSGIALFDAGAGQAGLRHFAFRVDRRNFELAQEELRARGIAFEYQDHDVSRSIYLTDPDGLQVELTTYEL